MDFKKFIIGSLAGGILAFLLGWLIYGILLKNYMHHWSGEIGHIGNRGEPVMLYLVLGNLFYGAFLAFVFLKANVKSLIDGFITGAIIGLLVSCSIDFIMYATTKILSKHAIMADVIASAIMAGIVGAVVAVAMGGKKES